MLLNKPEFYYLELTCNSCSLLTPNLHVPSGLHATISEIPATNHYNMESLASMLTLKAVAFSFSPPSFKKIHTHTHTPLHHTPPTPPLKAIFSFILAGTTGTTSKCLVLNFDLLLLSFPICVFTGFAATEMPAGSSPRLLQCPAPPLHFSQS